MTQIAATTAPAVPFFPVHRVWGKDRLSDAWTCAEFRFRWQAEEWAAQRAFVMLNEDETVRIGRGHPRGRSRIEWVVLGGWAPYTAWEEPEHRTSQLEWIEREIRRGSMQTFRVVIEDEPDVLVEPRTRPV